MIFLEGTDVIYENMSGVITFVGTSYVVIDIPNSRENCSCAKLLVYSENYSKIEIISK